jgi:hypothetical protein
VSFPKEFKFAKIKFSDGAVIPVFTALCGIYDVTVNEVAETTQTRTRDCDALGGPGVNELKVVGTNWTISGTGITNADQTVVIGTNLFAKQVEYLIEAYALGPTPAGVLLGTFEGSGILTARNLGIPIEGESSLELTIEGTGLLAYTPVP